MACLHNITVIWRPRQRNPRKYLHIPYISRNYNHRPTLGLEYNNVNLSKTPTFAEHSSETETPTRLYRPWHSSLGFYRAMLRTARLCHSMSSVRLSVSPSVTFRYRDHIGWKSSKIISRPNSLSLEAYARADPNMGDLVQREHP